MQQTWGTYDIIHTNRYRDSKSGNGSEYDLSIGSVVLAPSTLFYGGWKEGIYNVSEFVKNTGGMNIMPFESSELLLNSRFNTTIPAKSKISLKVYKANGIGIYCGTLLICIFIYWYIDLLTSLSGYRISVVNRLLQY